MSSAAMTRERALATIYAAIDAVNEGLPAGRRLAKSPETLLFASDGALDSLGLVSLVIDVEQRLADELGVPVTLADEKAMSQRNSPFRSVGTLAEYASSVIEEARRA